MNFKNRSTFAEVMIKVYCFFETRCIIVIVLLLFYVIYFYIFIFIFVYVYILWFKKRSLYLHDSIVFTNVDQFV